MDANDRATLQRVEAKLDHLINLFVEADEELKQESAGLQPGTVLPPEAAGAPGAQGTQLAGSPSADTGQVNTTDQNSRPPVVPPAPAPVAQPAPVVGQDVLPPQQAPAGQVSTASPTGADPSLGQPTASSVPQTPVQATPGSPVTPPTAQVFQGNAQPAPDPQPAPGQVL